MPDHLFVLAAAFGPQMAGVRLWEVVVVLGLAGTVMSVALWGSARSRSGAFTSEKAGIAVIDEIHAVDNHLSRHATGLLTLSTVAAGAFGTVIMTNGALVCR